MTRDGLRIIIKLLDTPNLEMFTCDYFLSFVITPHECHGETFRSRVYA